MKKILVQNFNARFFNNMDALSAEYEVVYSTVDKNIYKIDQTIKPDIYILNMDTLSYEEIHFCNSVERNIFLYTKTDKNHWNTENANKIKVIKESDIKKLYNPNRFFCKNQNRNIDLAYFLDNDSDIPKEIKSEIYPNKVKQKLKMFNNRNIVHPQNMGFLDEENKVSILNSTKTFITKNLFYAAEAMNCGCKVVDLNMNEIDVNIKEYITYKEYFEKLI